MEDLDKCEGSGEPYFQDYTSQWSVKSIISRQTLSTLLQGKFNTKLLKSENVRAEDC